MHNELTRQDLELMRQELDHRRLELRPQLIEAVKEARAFGDLSENFEYKAAKKEKNRNDSRIRYLENMIRTAVVIEDRSGQDTVGLYDRVTVYLEEDDEETTFQIVTTCGRMPSTAASARSPRWAGPCWAKKRGTGCISKSTTATAMT